MHSVLIELLKTGNAFPLLEGKGNINCDYVATKCMVSNSAFWSLFFLSRKGPAAEGKAVGPFLKLTLKEKVQSTPCTRKGAADIEDAYGDAPPPADALKQACPAFAFVCILGWRK